MGKNTHDARLFLLAYWDRLRSGFYLSSMLGFSITLHFSQGLLLVFWPEAGFPTAVGTFVEHTGGDHIASGFLLMAAALIGLGAIASNARAFFLFLGLVPQQLVLISASYGALRAIITSQFLDGVPRNGAFIAADQLPVIVALAFHSIAMIRLVDRRARLG